MHSFVKKGNAALRIKNIAQGRTADHFQIHNLNPRLFESNFQGTKKVGGHLTKQISQCF